MKKYKVTNLVTGAYINFWDDSTNNAVKRSGWNSSNCKVEDITPVTRKLVVAK